MIEILVPVLGRPERAQLLVDSLRATCSHPLTFLCTQGDEAQISACVSTGEYVKILPVGTHHQYPLKMNVGVEQSVAEFVFLGADDITFTPGWDDEALRVATETGATVIATNDMANGSVRRGKFGTHCLVSRRYVTEEGGIDGPGMLHEGYDHNFVDRELCGVAQSRGRFAFASHSIVRHHHPLFDRSVRRDKTYQKGLSTFHQDRELFLRRAHLWNYEGLSSAERNVAKRYRRDIVRAR